MHEQTASTSLLLSLGLILVALLAALPCQARQVDLSRDAQYLEDPTGKLTFAEVSGDAYASRFVSAARGELNFGYSDSTFWVRVRMGSGLLGSTDGLLELGYFSLEHIELFAPGQPGVTGGRHDERSGTWPFRHTVFPVALKDAPVYYYLRVRSSGSVTIPLTLWDLREFNLHSQKLYLALGLYYGALAALVLYNLLLFLSLRERNFLLYSSFAALMGLGIVSGNGIGHQFLWPDWTEWSTRFSTFTLGLAEIFAIHFSQSFLNTARHTPRLHRFLWGTAGLVAITVAGAPWVGISGHHAELLMSLFGALIAALIPWASIVALRQGERGARFYLLAWGILWCGTMAAALRNFGLLPTNAVTAYAVQLSSAFEMLLISFALADRIHLEREKKERAQAQADAARQALVETLRSSGHRLETLVSERTEQLNQSLESEQRMLERYVRFGALISHEFRNPLAIIRGNVDSMAKESGQSTALAAIRSSAARLETMFEEWLQSDRLSSEDASAHPVTIDLPQWLDALTKDCAAYYSDHLFELRLDSSATSLYADEPLLRIAVHNLIDNAVKYSPAGKTITVETVRKAGMTGVRVSDEGKGIAKPDRERIYAEYFRVDRHSAGGFGLGLAFVNRIVRLHGGEIELESEPDTGSRFCLWFPQPRANVIPPTPAPMAILLVEDLKANVMIIRAQLLREGHQVTAAETGEEALEILELERFDLVLMDLQLPGIDGFEATRRLRAATDRRVAETPVFALTTNVLSHTEAACRAAGMDAVISKPLRMEEFNATVAGYFNGQGKRRRSSQ